MWELLWRRFSGQVALEKVLKESVKEGAPEKAFWWSCSGEVKMEE